MHQARQTDTGWLGSQIVGEVAEIASVGAERRARDENRGGSSCFQAI